MCTNLIACPSCILAALTYWEAQVALYKQGLSVQSAKQSVFMDLVVKTHRALGGCDLWQAFIVDDISTSLITFAPISITMVAKTTLESSFEDVTLTCNASGVPAAIVKRFTELAMASAYGSVPSVNVISTFECGEQTWRVGQCAEIAVPYICVDCFIDTCKAATSSLFESRLIPSSFWYQDSCLSSEDVESGHDGWFRSLVVDFDFLAEAPGIVSLATSSPSKNDIQIDLVLDDDEGAVVCAAYPAALDFIPAEVRTLQLQNQQVEIISKNTSFVISGLTPAVSYDLYCATFSLLDAVMSNEAMLATRTTQTTSCCRLVEVSIMKSSVSNNEDAPNAVAVSLAALLPEDLTLTFTTTYYADESAFAAAGGGGGVVGNPFVPSSFSFSSSSVSLSKNIAYVSALASTPGVYYLDFQLSGASAGSYAVSYGAGNKLIVLDAEIEPAAPAIHSATFSADGSHFVVLFDSATNRGNGNNNFLCSTMLAFNSVTSETQCRWSDDLRVEVYSNGNAGAVVNETVSLRPQVLKAKCRVLGNGGPECSAWAHSALSSAAIQPPPSPSPPSLSFIAPAQIGRCDALSLDLSSSSGGGGRKFASWKFSVKGRHVNVSKIESFLNQARTIRRPITVPTAMLHSGYAYSFSVTVCTFLGGCSLASRTVVVSSSGNVPVASLKSEKIRNVNRYAALKLRGDGFTSQCDGSTSSANLAFTWELKVSSAAGGGFVVVTDPALQSTAIDPRFFVLPAFSLPVGALYSLVLTVQHLVSRKYSSSSISLTAVKGHVVAVVSGSSEVGLQTDRELVIDAGDSYDEDNNLAVGTDAGLIFTFDCKQVFPFFNDGCLLGLAALSASSVSASVPQNNESMIGSVHEVTVAVQHYVAWERHVEPGRRVHQSRRGSLLRDDTGALCRGRLHPVSNSQSRHPSQCPARAVSVQFQVDGCPGHGVFEFSHHGHCHQLPAAPWALPCLAR